MFGTPNGKFWLFGLWLVKRDQSKAMPGYKMVDVWDTWNLLSFCSWFGLLFILSIFSRPAVQFCSLSSQYLAWSPFSCAESCPYPVDSYKPWNRSYSRWANLQILSLMLMFTWVCLYSILHSRWDGQLLSILLISVTVSWPQILSFLCSIVLSFVVHWLCLC